METKFHTKSVIATRKANNQTINLVKCTPKPMARKASTFFEERDETGTVISFDGGGVLFNTWEENGWI